MSGTPSVDSLLTIFKGLQREKTCLQVKLKETQDRKMLLRSQVRGMNIKHHQKKETNSKLKETLNVARAMLEKSQQQQKAMQEEITKKRQIVETLNAKVAEEKGKHQQNTIKLQCELAELSDRFTEARKFHTENNLDKEIAALQDRGDQLKTKTETVRTETSEIESRLKQLKLKQGAEDGFEIDPQIQRAMIGKMKSKNAETCEHIDKMTNKIAQAKEEIKKLQQSPRGESMEN